MSGCFDERLGRLIKTSHFGRNGAEFPLNQVDVAIQVNVAPESTVMHIAIMEAPLESLFIVCFSSATFVLMS